jgi:cellulose synthase/poly-beta-1,6-N-acetylglucosamine synthase-like glycosyltransferase
MRKEELNNVEAHSNGAKAHQVKFQAAEDSNKMNGILVSLEIVLAFLAIGAGSIFLVTIFFGSRKPKLKIANNFLPTVSVVIPTRNEEKTIDKRLENILAMEYPREKLEILFVDASADSTPERIASYASKYSFIKMVKQEGKGFNAALNQGYSVASGEIKVKSDCDSFPAPDALIKLVRNFADDSVGVVSGIYSVPKASRTEKLFRAIQTRILLSQSFFHSTFIAHGGFSGYRSNIIPQLPANVTSDDSEVVLSAVKRGYRAIIDPEVSVVEYVPENFVFRREMKDRRAASVIKVIMSNLGMLFNRKYGAFGLLCYPMTFFILVLAPLAFSVFLILLTVFGVLYYLPALLAVCALSILFAASLMMKNKLATALRTLGDVYISCVSGFLQSFRMGLTWKRSEEQRILA